MSPEEYIHLPDFDKNIAICDNCGGLIIADKLFSVEVKERNETWNVCDGCYWRYFL